MAEQAIDEKEPNGQFEDIGCNVATLDGQTIHWTSAFLTTNYELGEVLQVTVIWGGPDQVCPMMDPQPPSPSCGVTQGLGVRG